MVILFGRSQMKLPTSRMRKHLHSTSYSDKRTIVWKYRGKKYAFPDATEMTKRTHVYTTCPVQTKKCLMDLCGGCYDNVSPGSSSQCSQSGSSLSAMSITLTNVHKRLFNT